MFTRSRYIMYNIFCECLHSLWPGFCSFCVLSLAIWEVAFHCQEVFIQSKFQSCAHIWRKWNLRPCHSNELLPERPHAWTLNAENAWRRSLPQWELQSSPFYDVLTVDTHQCSHFQVKKTQQNHKNHVAISWPFVLQLALHLRSLWTE